MSNKLFLTLIKDAMKTNATMRILIVTILCVVSHLCYSQIDTGWVRRYVGPVFSDETRAICVDNDGNVIVTGTSVGITGGQFYDWLTIKYTSNGDVVWTQRQNGTCDREDIATDIAVDKFNNVYVTGSFSDTIQSLGNCTSNAAFIKYSPSGELLWLREWDGEPEYIENGNSPVALVIDDSCNIYITGFFYAVDPYQGYDFFTLKYDSAGTFQWARTYNGICTYGNDYPSAITLDKVGNIYVTGKSDSEPYFWKEDYLTVSYSPQGVERWVRRYDANGYTDIPQGIVSDDSCNVYVTGYSDRFSRNMLTIKYDSTGTEKRIERYQAFWETRGNAIALDTNENIYIAGNHGDSYLTVRYNPDWTIEWTKEYWAPGGLSGATQIVISGDTALFASGSSLCDIFTIKYDLNGNYKGAQRYSGTPGGCDWASDIAVDESGLVYVCGYSEGAGTGGDYVTIQYKSMNYDYGDAPDDPYPTLLESNGARHIIDHVVFLGELVDNSEPDGMPTDFADGDDLDNLDDEDGVVFNSELREGQNASITIKASVDYGFLNAWVDFNRDGDWNDGNEQIFTNQLLSVGTQELNFSIPKSGVWYSYNSYARFRYSSQADLLPTDLAIDGEVEDYFLMIEPPYVFDFGDAPDAQYQTLLQNNGAYHFVDDITYLGMLVDAEADGQPTALALGDDLNNLADEDGVSFQTPVIPGETATVQVIAASECLLNAWIDFNCINSWADPGEHIFVNQSLSAGINLLIFNVPFSAIPGNTYARFRVNQYAGISWFGYGYEGEVEDYMVKIYPHGLLNLQDVIITPGIETCFDATQTITTAGNGTFFIVKTGAIVHLIAGQNILILPGTYFQTGADVHAYIDQTGEFCSNPKVIVAQEEDASIPADEPVETRENQIFFKVHPNPTSGQFTLELKDASETADLRIEIFSMIGERVIHVEQPGMKQHRFDLSAKQRGVYLIRVLKGSDVGVVKLIIQ